MSIAIKIANKLVNFPSSVAEKIRAHRKMEYCIMGDGAKLYPSCSIENPTEREFISVGARSQILGQLSIYPHGGKISIGESCFVGQNTRIWSTSLISIGNNVLISHGVNIHDSNSHSFSAFKRRDHFRQIFTDGHPLHLEDVKSSPIVIEDDAWIGFGAAVMRGVTVGRGAIVGAGSIITNNVAPYSIVAGNPPRAIGSSAP
jgi:acetyltransferase-like isoleucine patch superfamily enzyme